MPIADHYLIGQNSMLTLSNIAVVASCTSNGLCSVILPLAKKTSAVQFSNLFTETTV